VISRIFEEAGLSTIAISLVREHTVKVNPARSVFVPFPLGLPLGHPGNAAEQRAVLDLAFSTLEATHGPVLVQYGDPEAAEAGSPLQASDVAIAPAASDLDFATEVTLMRRYWEQHKAATGRTAVGLTGVPPERFRGIVRFLEAFLSDEQADSSDRPAATEVPAFIRLCVEDLRVLYVEARLQSHPHESTEDRQRWLFGETALGVFLRKLKDRMEASSDPKIKAGAFGIAR
jgi:hypothetical protein